VCTHALNRISFTHYATCISRSLHAVLRIPGEPTTRISPIIGRRWERGKLASAFIFYIYNISTKRVGIALFLTYRQKRILESF
jgi:hypothetical protein